jgi:cysteine dioxygenase
VLKGEIRETRFAIPRNPGKDGPLVETSTLKFGLNKVAYMADEVSSLSKFRLSSRADVIFSLVFIPSPILIRLNMLSLFIVSTTTYRENSSSYQQFEVYFPPNAAMRGCQIYDIENGGVQHVMQGAYDSVEGKVPGINK